MKSIEDEIIEKNVTESSYSENSENESQISNRDSSYSENSSEVKEDNSKPVVASINGTSGNKGDSPRTKMKKHVQFKKRPIIRYTFIFASCSIWVGAVFTQSFNGLLKIPLKQELNLSEEQLSLFQTLSSAPAIPFSFFGGILLDKVGIRIALILYSFLVMLGALLFSIGGYIESYPLILVGKIVNMIGGEAQSGAINSLFAKWFTGGDLARISTINLFFGRVAGSSAGWIYTPLYEATGGLFMPLFIGFLMTLFSFLMMIVAGILDKKADAFKLTLGEKPGQRKLFSFADIKKLSLMFYLLMLINAVNYGIHFPLSTNLVTVFKNKFSIDSATGGRLISIVLLTGLSSPLWGYILDKFGGQPYFYIASSVFGVTSLGIFYGLPGCDSDCSNIVLFPMISLGLFLTLFTVVIWTTIAQSVPLENIGTAYGLTLSMKNLFTCVIPVFVGQILDSPDTKQSIQNLLLMFLILAIISLIISLSIFIYNKGKGGIITQRKLTVKELKQLRRSTTFGMDI